GRVGLFRRLRPRGLRRRCCGELCPRWDRQSQGEEDEEYGSRHDEVPCVVSGGAGVPPAPPETRCLSLRPFGPRLSVTVFEAAGQLRELVEDALQRAFRGPRERVCR